MAMGGLCMRLKGWGDQRFVKSAYDVAGSRWRAAWLIYMEQDTICFINCRIDWFVISHTRHAINHKVVQY